MANVNGQSMYDSTGDIGIRATGPIWTSGSYRRHPYSQCTHKLDTIHMQRTFTGLLIMTKCSGLSLNVL